MATSAHEIHSSEAGFPSALNVIPLVKTETREAADFYRTTWGMYIDQGGDGRRPQVMLNELRLPVSPLAVKLVELLMENPGGLAKRTLHLRLGVRLGSKVAPEEAGLALATVKDQLGRFGYRTELQELERVRPGQASVPTVILRGVVSKNSTDAAGALLPGSSVNGENYLPGTSARSWAQAACRDADPDIFTYDSEERVRSAREFCRRCPIVVMCLNEALQTDTYGHNPHNVEGVLGGLSLGERREFAKRGGLGAAGAHEYWQEKVGITLDAPIKEPESL